MEKTLPLPPKPVAPVIIETFYLTPKNGGFHLRKVTIKDKTVVSDMPVSDPDAWNQVMSELEHELSKKLQ